MNCGRQLDAVTRPDLWVEKFFSQKFSNAVPTSWLRMPHL